MYLGLWLGQGALTVVKIASEDVCLLLVLDVNPAMTYFRGQSRTRFALVFESTIGEQFGPYFRFGLDSGHEVGSRTSTHGKIA